MVKAILGYDIMPGMSIEDYEKWLKEVHLPDLSKVPGLKRVVLNTVKGLVRGKATFYRIAAIAAAMVYQAASGDYQIAGDVTVNSTIAATMTYNQHPSITGDPSILR